MLFNALLITSSKFSAPLTHTLLFFFKKKKKAMIKDDTIQPIAFVSLVLLSLLAKPTVEGC